MPELLVQVIDRASPNPLVDCRCYKAGDVIVVCPDGWGWTPAELNSQEWRIISVDIPMAEAEALVEDETGDQLLNPLLQIRGAGINIDALPPQAIAKMRGNRAGTVTISAAAIRLAKAVKARRQSAQILGQK